MINSLENAQNSLFDCSAKGDLLGVERALAGGALVDVLNKDGRTALGLAANAGSLRSIEALLAAGANPNAGSCFSAKPLAAAAKNGHAHCIASLAAAGANVREKEAPRQREPGVLYDCGGMVSIAAFDNRADVICELIKAGADPDEQYDGTSALGVAICLSQREAAFALLERGASASFVDSSDGKTLAMHAANVGFLEIMDPLAEHGCDFARKSNKGSTALSIASSSSYTDCAQAIGAILARAEKAELERLMPSLPAAKHSGRM